MDTSFSWILNHSVFESAISKLTINAELSETEKEGRCFPNQPESHDVPSPG